MGRTAFERAVDPVDAVLDTLGGAVQQKSLGVIKRGGVLVSAVSQPDLGEAERRGIRADLLPGRGDDRAARAWQRSWTQGT